MNLSEAKFGLEYTIINIEKGKLAPRLISIGVLQGTKVKVMSKSIFGDSYHVKIGKVNLGLRSVEMKGIIIQL